MDLTPRRRSMLRRARNNAAIAITRIKEALEEQEELDLSVDAALDALSEASRVLNLLEHVTEGE